MCQVEWTEYFIKPARQRTRRALDVQTKAGVAHQMGNRKGRLVVTG